MHPIKKKKKNPRQRHSKRAWGVNILSQNLNRESAAASPNWQSIYTESFKNRRTPFPSAPQTLGVFLYLNVKRRHGTGTNIVKFNLCLISSVSFDPNRSIRHALACYIMSAAFKKNTLAYIWLHTMGCKKNSDTLLIHILSNTHNPLFLASEVQQ